jgi:hypothetical protein
MELPLTGVLAALGSGLAFALYQITIKRMHGAKAVARGKPVSPHPLEIPSWLGLLFPFWALALLASWQSEALTFNLTWDALRWPLAWAVCTVVSTTGLVWLLRWFSLAEVAGYKKALITLGALAVDMGVFGLHFPLFTLLAIALLLGGALGLSSARNRLPKPYEWGVILLWCGVLVLQIALYKYGLQQQPQVLAHTLLAQTFATLAYAALWLIPAIRRQPTPKYAHILAFWGAALAGTLLEGFAYAGLPLALVLVVTMLPAALMAGHDVWRGDLPKAPSTWAALTLLALGFALLVF